MLLATNPELSAEISPNSTIQADEVTAKSGKKLIWVCSQSHEWEATVANRSLGRGCPYCAGRKVLKGFNDIGTTHPELTKHIVDENDAYSLSSGSRRKIELQCTREHRWTLPVYRAVETEALCPYCSDKKMLEGFNDLATKNPFLSSQVSTESKSKPPEVSYRSKKKLLWECSEGHTWEASVIDRVKGGNCPYCQNRKVLKGFNDLFTTNPELAVQISAKNSVSGYEITEYSNRNMIWDCSICGKEWEAIVSNRSRGRGCPYCAGKRPFENENDLGTLSPHLMQEWNDENNPSSFTNNSGYSANWKCQKGHEWKARISDRTRKDSPTGCPICWNTTFVSAAEQELHDFIADILPDGVLVEQSNRKLLNGKELDIYIPEKKIAVEFNGLYWHTEEQGKDKWYHYSKWKECKDKGTQLITVWEDSYRDNPELVKNMLAYKLGVSKGDKIAGRRTYIDTEISTVEAKSFYHSNHIQGYRSGLHIGLRDKGTLGLVALSTWTRESGREQISLERYATSQVVQGGFSKVLKYAYRTFAEEGFSRIVTFADHTVSNGSLYANNGFSMGKVLSPDYSYISQGNRIHKFNYRLKRFKNDPNLLWKKGVTEKSLAKINGIPKVWDCGKTRWVLDIK